MRGKKHSQQIHEEIAGVFVDLCRRTGSVPSSGDVYRAYLNKEDPLWDKKGPLWAQPKLRTIEGEVPRLQRQLESDPWSLLGIQPWRPWQTRRPQEPAGVIAAASSTGDVTNPVVRVVEDLAQRLNALEADTSEETEFLRVFDLVYRWSWRAFTVQEAKWAKRLRTGIDHDTVGVQLVRAYAREELVASVLRRAPNFAHLDAFVTVRCFEKQGLLGSGWVHALLREHLYVEQEEGWYGHEATCLEEWYNQLWWQADKVGDHFVIPQEIRQVTDAREQLSRWSVEYPEERRELEEWCRRNPMAIPYGEPEVWGWFPTNRTGSLRWTYNPEREYPRTVPAEERLTAAEPINEEERKE